MDTEGTYFCTCKEGYSGWAYDKSPGRGSTYRSDQSVGQMFKDLTSGTADRLVRISLLQMVDAKRINALMFNMGMELIAF